jgi:predicted dehydrogenase
MGYIGLRHSTILKNHPSFELIAVCDIDPKARADANELGVPVWSSLEELLANSTEAEVVSICTPNNLHSSQGEVVVNAGKHVVIEKPMDIDPDKCLSLIELANTRNRMIFCVMQNRYSPPSKWLKQILEETKLGEIYLVQVNCYWNRDDSYYSRSSWKGTLSQDGGPLFTQFSHFMDLLFWLFGDVELESASFDNFNHQSTTEFEDSGIVHFRLGQRALGAFHYSTAVWGKNFESSITIIGEKGTVRVGGQYMEKVEYCHIQDYIMPVLAPSNPPNQYPGYSGSASNHQYIFDNVVDALQRGEKPTIDPMEGFKVVEIIDRIYQRRK